MTAKFVESELMFSDTEGLFQFEYKLLSLNTKFSLPANLTTYTILSLFSLQVEPDPHLLSP